MELPLFPLNTVLCPGIALPLHVFEDRYRAMVRHCLETTSPFGVVLIRQGREVGSGVISFTGIGTIAEIRDAGSYDDGRYDLLVVGTRRFEIRHVLSGKQPYLVAEVDLLDEAIGDEQVAQQLAMRATRRFVTYLELLQPRSGETADEIDVRVEIETEDDEPGDEPGDEPEAGLDDLEAEPDDDPVAGSVAAAGDLDAAGAAVPPDGSGSDAPRRRRVMIPDDPTVLSHLLAGILQVESPRRQALLEAETTEDRLRGLLTLIDRETFLLQRRLRFFQPESRVTGPRRS
ncbi:MAG TPA: LON peptidase substrate-binding domain-containing protein [Candidatus Limnocylindrales bacterium]|nr:LON peptidase substrate-binding domain-containing protein [Candidatus Limnocylindrales bacterium]